MKSLLQSGISFFNTSGGPCGVSTPYVASVKSPGYGIFKVAGCSAGNATGGPSAGQFTFTPSSAACTLVMNMGTGAVAPQAWSCWVNDLTATATNIKQYLGVAASPSAAASILTGGTYMSGITAGSGATGTVTLTGFTTTGGTAVETGASAQIDVKDGTINPTLVNITGGYNAVSGTLYAIGTTTDSSITITNPVIVTIAPYNIANAGAVFSIPASGTTGTDTVNFGCMAY